MSCTKNKSTIACGVLAGFMGIAACVMVLARLINIEIFFVLFLIAALIITELISPVTMRPRWRRLQFAMLAAGVAVFGFIIFMKIFEIIKPVLLLL